MRKEIGIISEGHIAFHIWPEYNYLAIDIFSCKKFNEKELKNFLKKKLGCKEIRSKKIKSEVIV